MTAAATIEERRLPKADTGCNGIGPRLKRGSAQPSGADTAPPIGAGTQAASNSITKGASPVPRAA